MAKHKVRDVAAPRHDREVHGKGIYGVAGGGLNGDGDIQMVGALSDLRRRVLDDFAEYVGYAEPGGKFFKLGYIDRSEAIDMMGSVESQFLSWSHMVNGACRDIALDVAGVTTVRVGVFRCFQGWEDPPGVRHPTAWWIPYEVRLPAGQTRKVYDDGTAGR